METRTIAGWRSAIESFFPAAVPRPFRPTDLQSIWILRDITASKLAEQEREAARRATVLAEISTILAHEIRNPLASMELFAGLIEQDLGAASQWISHLRAGIRTLSGTVNNVLSLNERVQTRLAPVRLAACVESGVEFVSPIADQAGLHLSFQFAAATLRVGQRRRHSPNRSEHRLCNAIRHTEASGRITVSTRQRTRRSQLNRCGRRLKTPAAGSRRASSHTSSTQDSVQRRDSGPGTRRLQAAHGPARRRDSRFEPH
jgi:signal transduction histidine kinase